MKTHKIHKSIICTLTALALILSASGLALASQAAIDSLKDRQDAIAQQKAELQSQINSLDTQVATVMEQKTALDEKNELARQEIEIIDEQIALYDGLIEKKSEELKEAQRQESEQKAALRVRMRAMEENGSLSYLAILFQATDFTDFLARMDYVSNIMEKDRALEKAYTAAKNAVADAKKAYEAAQEEQREKKAEAEAKKAQLERDIAEATALIIELQNDIEAYEAALDEQEAQEAAIANQINQLEAALEAQRQAGSGGTIVGTGRLIWPMPGYSPGSAYGWRLHPILGYTRFHAGEDIGAPTGTPILAADSGTVLQSTNGGGYGNYVTISHGGGMVTLYAHMSSRAVSAGDSVYQGQVIGYCGSTGLSTGPHLHYEVRVNGSTTDPKGYYNF